MVMLISRKGAWQAIDDLHGAFNREGLIVHVTADRGGVNASAFFTVEDGRGHIEQFRATVRRNLKGQRQLVIDGLGEGDSLTAHHISAENKEAVIDEITRKACESAGITYMGLS